MRKNGRLGKVLKTCKRPLNKLKESERAQNRTKSQSKTKCHNERGEGNFIILILSYFLSNKYAKLVLLVNSKHVTRQVTKKVTPKLIICKSYKPIIYQESRTLI